MIGCRTKIYIASACGGEGTIDQCRCGEDRGTPIWIAIRHVEATTRTRAETENCGRRISGKRYGPATSPEPTRVLDAVEFLQRDGIDPREARSKAQRHIQCPAAARSGTRGTFAIQQTLTVLKGAGLSQTQRTQPACPRVVLEPEGIGSVVVINNAAVSKRT